MGQLVTWCFVTLFKEATKQLQAFVIVKGIFWDIEFWLRILLGLFRWPFFHNRKYLQLCVGVPSEVKHDFSSDTVNISGWHGVRKIQKLFFFDIFVLLSEINFNGNKKFWCKLQPLAKGNPAVLNLDCNCVIPNWERPSKDWDLFLLSHQAISNAQVFAHVKSWHSW